MIDFSRSFSFTLRFWAKHSRILACSNIKLHLLVRVDTPARERERRGGGECVETNNNNRAWYMQSEHLRLLCRRGIAHSLTHSLNNQTAMHVAQNPMYNLNQ